MSRSGLADRAQGAARRADRPAQEGQVVPAGQLVARQQDVLNQRDAFAMALGDPKLAERFLRVALTALAKGPAYPGAKTLADCTRASLLGGLMTCAQLRLEPNDPRGLAYLIPYRNGRESERAGTDVVEAQLQIGYKGLIDLGYRSGQVKVLAAEAVHERDHYVESLWPRALEHRAATGDRGEVVRYYAAVEYVTGGFDFRSMTVAEVEAWRDEHSKAAYKRNGSRDESNPWWKHPDEMAKKTCLRRLAKMMPQSVEDLRVGLQLDGAVVQSQGPVLQDIAAVAASAQRPELEASPVDEVTGEIPPDAPPPDHEPDDPMAYSEIQGEPAQPAAPAVEMATKPQLAKVHAMLGGLGIRGNEGRHEWLSRELGRVVTTADDLTKAEASKVIEALEQAQREPS